MENWRWRGVPFYLRTGKSMSWVAINRGLRLADKRSFPAERQSWMETRDAIYEETMEHGWNPEVNSFVQSYASESLDSSNLVMPL
ncbi:MAG: glycoside hydrolase family 15 protein, partial [SAR202 cluster bacterium]|nr:glycoside hydrolase family 15 protein [SAR202 cluster bacterium]